MKKEEFKENRGYYNKRTGKYLITDIPDRWGNLKVAHTIAKEMFPDGKVYVVPSSKEYVKALLCIEDTHICVKDEEQMECFKQMISEAICIDIELTDKNKIIMKLCFCGTFEDMLV